MSEIKQKNVVAGKNTRYHDNIKIIPGPEGVEIGNYCAIGSGLIIMGINHDYNYPALQYNFHKKLFNKKHPGLINKTKSYSKGKIIIGSDVWIGDNVSIMSGVKIGHGCVIGLGSVVTKNLEPYSICAGIPCKKIKNRYSNDIIEYLLKI